MARIVALLSLAWGLAACTRAPLVVGELGDAGIVGTACDRNADCSTQACCNHVCIDLERDAKNCGGCGTICAAGKTCVGSDCVAVLDASTVDDCTPHGGECAPAAKCQGDTRFAQYSCGGDTVCCPGPSACPGGCGPKQVCFLQEPGIPIPDGGTPPSPTCRDIPTACANPASCDCLAQPGNQFVCTTVCTTKPGYLECQGV